MDNNAPATGSGDDVSTVVVVGSIPTRGTIYTLFQGNIYWFIACSKCGDKSIVYADCLCSPKTFEQMQELENACIKRDFLNRILGIIK